jgi:hypothetical protein
MSCDIYYRISENIKDIRLQKLQLAAAKHATPFYNTMFHTPISYWRAQCYASFTLIPLKGLYIIPYTLASFTLKAVSAVHNKMSE